MEDGHLYAFEVETGDLRWEFPTKMPWGSAPAPGDGIVLFGSEDQHVYAIVSAEQP